MKRRLTKTILWSVMAFFITCGVVYAFTGNLLLAASVSAISRAIKFAAYYGMETLFDRHWPITTKAIDDISSG